MSKVKKGEVGVAAVTIYGKCAYEPKAAKGGGGCFDAFIEKMGHASPPGPPANDGPLSVAFTVPMAPKGKPRHHARIVARGQEARTIISGLVKTGQVFVHEYPDGKGKRWEEQFAFLCSAHRPRQPLEGSLILHILAVLPRPKALCRKKDPEGLIWCGKKPDFDNVQKSVADALTVAGWWRDDGQIADARIQTVYAEKEGMPRVVVEIRQLATTGPGPPAP